MVDRILDKLMKEEGETKRKISEKKRSEGECKFWQRLVKC